VGSAKFRLDQRAARLELPLTKAAALAYGGIMNAALRQDRHSETVLPGDNLPQPASADEPCLEHMMNTYAMPLR
jgi:hypothetical protein